MEPSKVKGPNRDEGKFKPHKIYIPYLTGKGYKPVWLFSMWRRNSCTPSSSQMPELLTLFLRESLATLWRKLIHNPVLSIITQSEKRRLSEKLKYKDENTSKEEQVKGREAS